MILGTKGRYAVMAMVDLANRASEKPTCLSDIAAAQEIPLAYLEQIFAKLKRNGLVRSIKGPGGGYALARLVEDTWISDIVMAVEESIKMTRCEKHSGAGCMTARTRCLTHDLWEGLEDHIYAYLRSISLRDVCNRQVREKTLQLFNMNEETELSSRPPLN